MNKGSTKFGQALEKLERVMRFELTTSTLARLRSTPELHPRLSLSGWQGYYVMQRVIQVPSRISMLSWQNTDSLTVANA